MSTGGAGPPTTSPSPECCRCSVPHLDREFDHLVPAEQSDDAQPGVRCVRFHGRLVDAFILERRSNTDHVGQLGWLDRVISAKRCSLPRCVGWSMPWRPATPAPGPTCCGWPSRHATPGRRRARQHRHCCPWSSRWTLPDGVATFAGAVPRSRGRRSRGPRRVAGIARGPVV